MVKLIGMIQEFRDAEDKKVGSDQLPALDIYKDVLIDPATNLIKVKRIYENGSLAFVNYVLYAEENEQDKLDELKNICDRFSIVVRNAQGADTIETEKEFEKDILLFWSRYLVRRGFKVCWETLDLNTGLADYKKTDKYYFDDDGEELLEASYNDDGFLESIIYKPCGDNNWGQDWEYYDQASFPDLQAKFTDNIDYYLTATLEP